MAASLMTAAWAFGGTKATYSTTWSWPRISDLHSPVAKSHIRTLCRRRQPNHQHSLNCSPARETNLIIGATGQHLPVLARHRHPHPITMSLQRFRAIARRNFPYSDRFIARSRYQQVAGREEGDRRNRVVVAVEGSEVGIVVLDRPEFDC